MLLEQGDRFGRAALYGLIKRGFSFVVADVKIGALGNQEGDDSMIIRIGVGSPVLGILPEPLDNRPPGCPVQGRMSPQSIGEVYLGSLFQKEFNDL